VALEIGEGFVCYVEDHVLDAMVEALGLHIERERRPFEPETDAYVGYTVTRRPMSTAESV
jgi:urease accessory protein